MEATRTILTDLAMLFAISAVVSLLFQRVRQPVVLGYLLVGVLVGPHTPIPLFVDHHRVEALAELGVVLVMFSIGLEFSVGKLVKLLPTAGVTGLIQMAGMLVLGYTVGRLFGWTGRESLFLGAGVSVSSTMIVARVFDAEKVTGALRETVFGILVVQDIGAILLITLLTAVAGGAGLPFDQVIETVGMLGLFLLGTMALGMLIVPRLVRTAAGHEQPETVLVVAIGVCFGLALLAEAFGYSVALGAFIGGTLVAESGRRHDVEHLVAPVRDLFAAVFFVSVGMLVEPEAMLDSWGVIVALTAVIIVAQPVLITLGGFLATGSLRRSVRAGMSLAQIGEFSFIIATVGVSAGVVSPKLFAVAVAVSALTAFTTPWMVAASLPAALKLEGKLPHRVQHFTSLYAGWLERLRNRPGRPGSLRRLWLLIAVDVALLLAVVAGSSAGARWLRARLEADAWVEPVAGLVATLVLGAPFALGILRVARRLGHTLAVRILPDAEGDDPTDIPRRALTLTLQLLVVLAVGLPVLAVMQVWLPLYFTAALFGALLLVLTVPLWRSTSALEDQLQAGAQSVLVVLDRQRAEETPHDREHTLPGLGPLVSHPLAADAPAVGRTLAQLNLRGLTGANVIAIERADGNVVVPSGHEALQAGDVLALHGASPAVEAAIRLIDTGETPAL